MEQRVKVVLAELEQMHADVQITLRHSFARATERELLAIIEYCRALLRLRAEYQRD